jgi:tetrahydromethanopterin S-methyltransferase subunit B
MAENESSSFQPVSSISQQQIQDIEERIAKLERRVDEMTNSQVQSTPTKPITQEDIVNVLNVTSSILGAVCILFAGLLWIDIFVISSHCLCLVGSKVFQKLLRSSQKKHKFHFLPFINVLRPKKKDNSS